MYVKVVKLSRVFVFRKEKTFSPNFEFHFKALMLLSSCLTGNRKKFVAGNCFVWNYYGRKLWTSPFNVHCQY